MKASNTKFNKEWAEAQWWKEVVWKHGGKQNNALKCIKKKFVYMDLIRWNKRKKLS